MEVEKRVATLDEVIALLGLEGEVEALRDDWTGKRADPRFAFVIPVSVRSLGGATPGPEIVCRLWDISRAGLCITSYFKFEENQELQVEIVVQDARWTGRTSVTHCTPTISGYKIGLRLADRARTDTRARSALAARTPSPTVEHPDVERVMESYRLARSNWGMLGIPVQRLVSGAAQEDVAVPAPDDGANRREHYRLRAAIDTHLILASSSGWHRISVVIEDISQGGMRLLVRHRPDQEQEDLTTIGTWTISVGMPIMVGFGREPDTLWVPAEVTRCEPAGSGMTRLAAQFETPRAIAFAGGSAAPGG